MAAISKRFDHDDCQVGGAESGDALDRLNRKALTIERPERNPADDSGLVRR